MQLEYHKKFQKKYKKLSPKIKSRFRERLVEFNTNPFLPDLNNHALRGEYLGCRSINITGDFRAIYEIIDKGVRFLDIDTHSNLYK
jgi:addiction module RelE/StbE family toxin